MSNLKKWSTRLPEDTIYRIRRHCANRALSIEEFAEIAIEDYIENYDKTNQDSENKYHARAALAVRGSDRRSATA